jgi:hypothetical protein
VDRVISTLNRANQRGGRMLSVVDLVEAGTLTLAQASWLSGHVLRGGSWLVGARPGGAGKTTVMAALLALVPPDAVVRLTGSDGGWRDARSGEYLISYELSPGFYDAYVWGPDVRRLTELGRAGCRLVANLHADTLEEARDQVVGQCGATEEGFRAFGVFLPLALRRGCLETIPLVERIHVARDGGWEVLESPPAVGRLERSIAGFLERCREQGTRLVEEVRAAWLAWSAGHRVR